LSLYTDEGLGSVAPRPPAVPVPRTLTRRLTDFAAALRAAGLPATPGHLLDAARTLTAVDITDPTDFFLALRAVYVRRSEDLDLFARVFFEFWDFSRPQPAPGNPAGEDFDDGEESGYAGFPSGSLSLQSLLTRSDLVPTDAPPMPDLQSAIRNPQLLGASAEEALRAKDFTTFDPQELAEARRLIARLAPRLATRPSRRHRPDAAGPRVDLRRTLHEAAAHAGETADLARRRRKLRRLRLALLCDVSGSMDPYSRFLIQFLYGLQRGHAGVETFVFGMRLTPVTAYLRGRPIDEGLDLVARRVRDWGGGTNIGGSLYTFNREHAHRVLGSKAVAIIVSDGWERGDPALLAEEMRTLRARAHRVLWLNPLLANPGYEPLTRGMKAALPHIDHFLPAHNLDSLFALTRTLRAL
jgi:uncharacterized protein with von Willebrand factor type A (vWA) domain